MYYPSGDFPIGMCTRAGMGLLVILHDCLDKSHDKLTNCPGCL